jgi:uncharacterized membrane protein YkoI
MKNKKWIWTAAVTLVVALIIIGGFQLWAPSLSAQSLTEDEANKAALNKYPGDILKTTKSAGEYHVEMQLETGVYHIRIDAKSGEVNSIKRGEKPEENPEDTTEETPEINEPKQLTQKQVEAIVSSKGAVKSIDLVQENNNSYYKAVVSKNNENITLKVDSYSGKIISSTKESPRFLTETEAISIAEEHVKGTVDEVDFYEPSNQTPYYLVEVEVNEDQEAVLQIDAYTREIKTVSWEDHDEDESDDDEE